MGSERAREIARVADFLARALLVPDVATMDKEEVASVCRLAKRIASEVQTTGDARQCDLSEGLRSTVICGDSPHFIDILAGKSKCEESMRLFAALVDYSRRTTIASKRPFDIVSKCDARGVDGTNPAALVSAVARTVPRLLAVAQVGFGEEVCKSAGKTILKVVPDLGRN